MEIDSNYREEDELTKKCMDIISEYVREKLEENDYSLEGELPLNIFSVIESTLFNLFVDFYLKAARLNNKDDNNELKSYMAENFNLMRDAIFKAIDEQDSDNE